MSFYRIISMSVFWCLLIPTLSSAHSKSRPHFDSRHTVDPGIAYLNFRFEEPENLTLEGALRNLGESKFHTLNFSGRIGAFEAIGQILAREQFQNIKSLDLSLTRLNDKTIRSLDLISTHPHLERLILNLNPIGDENWEEIIETFPMSLNYLSLYGTGIRESGLNAIRNHSSKFYQLRTLDLQGNDFSFSQRELIEEIQNQIPNCKILH